MKRLITILIIFLLMIGLSVTEIVITSKFYKQEYQLLEKLEQSFDKDPKNLNNDETVKAYENANDYWEKRKKYLMMVSNHNIVKYVDEKLVALQELIRMNQESDAYVALRTSMSYIEDLKKENYPLIHNIL